MKFELRSNNNNRPQKNNVGTDRDILQFPDPVGNTVSYRQPLLTNPLHSLSSAIANSSNLQKLAGRTYFLESNYGYISEVVPAVEYYKHGLNRIRDNLHTVEICESRIQNLLIEIGHHFQQNKEQRHNQQFSISFEREAYELRTEIANHVFLTRAVLDILSTLFQTVYGPSVGQFSSFGDLLKAIKNEKIQFQDNKLKCYLSNSNNIEWFYLLKDVRDYLAHYGAFKFSLREEGATLRIYVFRNKEVSVLISHLHQGLYSLLSFFNAHWANYLVAHNK